jgi:hypothetical protein
MSNPLYAVPALIALLVGCNAETASRRLPSTVAPVNVARDGSLMVPGKPQLAAMPATAVAGPQRLRWNMWWGENGRHWEVRVNGQPAGGGELASMSPKQQQGSVEVQLGDPGKYEIEVALCNDHGCSRSAPAVVEVVSG